MLPHLGTTEDARNATGARLRRRLLSLAAVFVALVVLAGCGFGVNDEEPPDLADIAHLARLTFPDDAQVTSSTYQGFQDWHVTAVVEFAASDLDAFLAINQLTPSEGLRAVTNQDRPVAPTWDPDSAAHVWGLDLSGEPVEGVFRRFLFDLDRPDTVVLYLTAVTL